MPPIMRSVLASLGLFALAGATVLLSWPYDGVAAVALLASVGGGVLALRRRHADALERTAEGVRERLNDEVGEIIQKVRERAVGRSHTD